MKYLTILAPPALLIMALATYDTDPQTAIFLFLLAIPALYTIAAVGLANFMAPAQIITYIVVIPPHFIGLYIVKLFLAFRWVILNIYYIVTRRYISKKLKITPRTFAELLTSGHLAAYHHKPRGRFLLGHNKAGLVWAQIGHIVHNLLITGTIGQGKSSILRSLLLSLLTKGPSIFKDWEFHIIDPKAGLGGHFSKIARAYPDNFTTSYGENEIKARLDWLYAQVVARGRAIQDAGADSPEQIGLPRMLIIIDDLQNIFFDRETKFTFTRLINSGRQAGAHIITVVPYSHSDIVKTYDRANFTFISARLPDNAIRVIGMKALKFLPYHHFLFQPDQLQPPILLTPFQITAQMIAQITESFIAPRPAKTDLFILRLFCDVAGGLGYRELIARGYGEIVSEGKKPPFPFTVYDPDKGKVAGEDTSKARDYVLGLLKQFETLGIAQAKPKTQGWAPLMGYPQAKKLYLSKEST